MKQEKPPRKLLFIDKNEQKIFLDLFTDFDEPLYKEIAKLTFCDGLTNEEVAWEVGYSLRHIERIRSQLMKVALKRVIKKLRELE